MQKNYSSIIHSWFLKVMFWYWNIFLITIYFFWCILLSSCLFLLIFLLDLTKLNNLIENSAKKRAKKKIKKNAPPEGIEPSTTSLKGWRSTAELKRQLIQFYKKFIIYMILWNNLIYCKNIYLNERLIMIRIKNMIKYFNIIIL